MLSGYLEQFSTVNYEIKLGEVGVVEDGSIYQVVNRHTGVREAEDVMLPRVIEYIRQLEEALSSLKEHASETTYDKGSYTLN